MGKSRQIHENGIIIDKTYDEVEAMLLVDESLEVLAE